MNSPASKITIYPGHDVLSFGFIGEAFSAESQ